MELRLPLLCRLPWPFGHRWRSAGVPNPAIECCARCGHMRDSREAAREDTT